MGVSTLKKIYFKLYGGITMDYEIIEQYQNEEGNKLYNLKIGEETFNGIRPIAKTNCEMCRKCKWKSADY